MDLSEAQKKMPKCIELVAAADKERVWNQPEGDFMWSDDEIDPLARHQRGIYVVEFVGVSKGKKPVSNRYRWNLYNVSGQKPINVLIKRAFRSGLKFLRIIHWNSPPTKEEISAVRAFNKNINAGKQNELFDKEGA